MGVLSKLMFGLNFSFKVNGNAPSADNYINYLQLGVIILQSVA